MKLYEFKQTLNKKDLIEYNYYVSKRNHSLDINSKLIGLTMVVLEAIQYANTKQINLSEGLFLAVGFACIFFILPVLRLFLMIKYRKHEDMEEMTVGFYDLGLLVCFTKELESLSETDVIIWENIKRVVERNGMFYVFAYNGERIIAIKKESIEDFAKFDAILDDKLTKGYRYLPKRVK